MVNSSWRSASTLLAVTIFVSIVSLLPNAVSSRITSIDSEHLSKKIRDRISKKIFHEGKFHSTIASKDKGYLISLYTRDVEAMWDMTGYAIPEILSALIYILLMSILVFALEPVAGSVFIVIALCFSYLFASNGKVVRKHFAKAAPIFDKLANFYSHCVDGYISIAANRSQFWAREYLHESNSEVARLASNAHRISIRFKFVTGSMILLGTSSVWIYSIWLFSSGSDSYTVGTLISILLYFGILVTPLQQIGGCVQALSKGDVALRRLQHFFTENTQEIAAHIVGSSSGFDEIEPQRMSLTLEDVSYEVQLENSHSTKKRILSAISLSANYGKIVGLAGESGSGKSTLLAVLARMISPTSGKVIISGIGIEHFDESNFRKHVKYVPQQSNLFPVSLADNILFSSKHIEKYLISQFAELEISELANRLSDVEDILSAKPSGGEMQRLSALRIILGQPRLLLLDEPSSSLDYTSTLRLISFLHNVIEKSMSTMIVASHDPLILKECDEIVLMENGLIVETDTYSRLTTNSEYFRKILRT